MYDLDSVSFYLLPLPLSCSPFCMFTIRCRVRIRVIVEIKRVEYGVGPK